MKTAQILFIALLITSTATPVLAQRDSVPTPDQDIGTAQETSREVKIARDELKDSYERLSAYFKDVTPMPRLDQLQEQEKIAALVVFLENLIKTGENALRDEAGFVAAFSRYALLVGKASVIFRKAAEHFRDKATAAKFPENREMYMEIARWYEARAERHDREGGAELPVTLEMEKEKLVEMLEVVRHFRLTLMSDPTFLAKDEALDLKAFRSNYGKLNDVLKSWRQQLQGNVEQLNPPVSPEQTASHASQEPVTPQGRPQIQFTALICSLKDEVPGGESAPVGSVQATSYPAPPVSTSNDQLDELFASQMRMPFALDKAETVPTSPEPTMATASAEPAGTGMLMPMLILLGVVGATGTVVIVLIARGVI